MSTNRSGFFSLHRFIGKKNKNEKASATNLSKSQTLSRPANDLQVTAPQNKIMPLPTAGHNAPFEQTFRITVCLPLGQLYVTRIGAKTKLYDLMDMICANKLLDPTKFAFTHPTAEMQIFDLDLTIGEVGLNEIKLTPKQHLQSAHVFSVKRSQASPYSSSNSLNSSDSSGMNSYLRTSNSNIQVPAVPTRKKRMAPRPPSQNSIPEDREERTRSVLLSSRNTIESIDEDSAVFKRPLDRALQHRNFHVSSPNLTTHHNHTLQLSSINDNDSSTDTSMGGSVDGRQMNESGRKPMNRPLSMQYNNHNESNLYKQQHSESSNSVGSKHSRTSSETSDIVKDQSLPEPTPRQRLFIASKKKAPAPPPRTIITNTAHKNPVVTPRCLLKDLSEEKTYETKKQEAETISNQASKQTENVEPVSLVIPMQESLKKPSAAANVSKVMLNMEPAVELSDANENDAEQVVSSSHSAQNEFVFSQQIKQNNEKSVDGNRRVSKTKINYSESIVTSSPGENEVKNFPAANVKPKSVSVVELNVEKTNGFEMQQPSIDQQHITEQVNAIIDEAVKVNEAKLNAENELKTKAMTDYADEINNNGIAYDREEEPESPVWNYKLPAPPVFADNVTESNNNEENISTSTESHSRSPKAESPIKPTLNENRTFDFQEYSDNSLPTSTVSTSNTMETPSTGPESLITSDIEDGYKGNDVEKRKIEINREQFIEHQFEFLSKHSNSDDEEDKSMSFEPSEVISSSTMIHMEKRESPIAPSTNGKTDVINELTQIISNNRLDTVIKANDDTNDQINSLKRSSLTNFHIGAYANGNHESVKTDVISSNEPTTNGHAYKRHSSIDCNTTTENGQVNGDSVQTNDCSDANENFTAPKQVSRSMSFHSTFAAPLVRTDSSSMDNKNAYQPLTARSTSYISLIGIQKYKLAANNPLNEATRQQSNSELSIADSPSLQSIEIIKSILSSSRAKTLPRKPSVDEKCNTNNAKATEVECHESKVEPKPEVSHVQERKNSAPSIQNTTTWKYQGPPSINLSTWGERPKSQVYIKSDKDYIFGGGGSKMAALQKRFSVDVNEMKKSEPANNSEGVCTIETCKKPIVRGFEYKKNVRVNGDGVVNNDATDSSPQLRSTRPSYEVSRLVNDKSFAEKIVPAYKTMTLDRHSSLKKFSEPIASKPFVDVNRNAKSNEIQRTPSLNGNQTDGINGNGVATQNGTKEVVKCEPRLYARQLSNVQLRQTQVQATEKPAFSQFTLRKTGLKEKILDECNNNSTKTIKTAPKIEEVKVNTTNIPLPPPILKKPLVTFKASTIPAATVEPRDQLLDSIRNFKRDTLKRSRLV